MGIFSTSAHERAKKTWEAATIAKRSLEDAALEMRDIEHTLQRITAELPHGTDGSAMKSVQATMEIAERHAHQTKVRLGHVKEQLRNFEEHLRRARKNG